MESGASRTILTSLCIITCGLLGLLASRFAMGSSGTAAPALMDAAHPGIAAAAVVVCLGAAVAIACALARPVNAAVTLFALGCGVAAFAMRTGTLPDAIFHAAGFRWLGVETLAWSAFVATAAVAAFRVGGPLPDVPWPDPDQGFTQSILRPRALLAMVAGVAAPAVLAFTLVGTSKGQAIGACTLAGIAVAVASRFIAPREQPVLVFAAPVLAIGLAQLILAMPPGVGLDASFASGSLNPILSAMPADAAAGSLCGVAVGLGWSKGLVKREPEA
ncbi:MAG: hypothetical protein EBQ99_04320 [Planctomycetes bacterium]|nr:hypothetical protein [Planctomycetota bacterium]